MVISLQQGQVVPSNIFEFRIWRAHKTIILVICFLWADLFEDDARSFHAFYKVICDKYSSSLYRDSKQACDAYFYIPARKEHRGTGGIFFDDLETFQCQVTKASFHSSHRCSLLWGHFKHLYLSWMKILYLILFTWQTSPWITGDELTSSFMLFPAGWKQPWRF